MTRGRLIWPFVASIARLDQAATSAGPPGFDPILQEPRTTRDVGAPTRVDLPVIQVPCQYDVVRQQDQQQGGSGNDPVTEVEITLHFQDLEDLGLVEATTGVPLIRVGDRLTRIDTVDGVLVRSYDPPLEARELDEESFGLSSLRRNLLTIFFHRPRRFSA